MKTITGDEYFIAGQPDMTIEKAQEMADTADEDQDEDPETSDEEKARNWALSGLSPEDFPEEDEESP